MKLCKENLMNRDDPDFQIAIQKLTHAAEEYEKIPADEDWNMIEIYQLEAEELIIDYCKAKGYSIDGYPQVLDEEINEDGYIIVDDVMIDEDFYDWEHHDLYLSFMFLEKDDVRDLILFYNLSFWPDQGETIDPKEWINYHQKRIEELSCKKFKPE